MHQLPLDGITWSLCLLVLACFGIGVLIWWLWKSNESVADRLARRLANDPSPGPSPWRQENPEGDGISSESRQTQTAPSAPPEDQQEQPPPVSDPPLFEVQQVGKAYTGPDGKPVYAFRLQGKVLEIRDGVTAILGPSGVGKSTLMGLLAGLDVPTNGCIVFAGQPLPDGESPQLQQHRSKNVSLVFQSLNLVTHLSTLENTALPLLVRGVPRQEALEKAARMLSSVNLTEEEMHRLPSQLSGGQQQRVAVARAFVAPSRIILADEPTGSLDPGTARTLMVLFRNMADSHHRPVVLITHNEEMARDYADRIVRLNQERGYVEEATPRQEQQQQVPRNASATRTPSVSSKPPRMGLMNQIRYAFSDLKHRRRITALTTLTVLISALYTLLIGFCGERVHFVQRQSLGQKLYTQVIALTPQVTDLDKRFTTERIAELAVWPEVALAFPRIEFNVQLHLEGMASSDILPLVGTVPEDPAAEPDRLVWGRAVSNRDAREALVSQRLLERLGGSLHRGSQPGHLTLEMKRKLAGRLEVRRIALPIVGVLRRETQEMVHVPLNLAARLNLWREGKLKSLAEGGGEGEGLTFPHAVAYTSSGRVKQAEEWLASYDLEGQQQGKVEVVESAGPIWLALEKEGLPEDVQRGLGQLNGVQVVLVFRGQLEDRKVLALAPSDPRWEQIDPPARLQLGWVGTRKDIPGVEDLVTTPETLRFLLFDPQGARARRATLVQATDWRAALALADLDSGKIESDVEQGWLVINTRGDPEDRENALFTSSRHRLRLDGQGVVRAVRVSGVLRKRGYRPGRTEVVLHSWPAPVYEQLLKQVAPRRKDEAASEGSRLALSCIYFTPEPGEAPETIQVLIPGKKSADDGKSTTSMVDLSVIAVHHGGEQRVIISERTLRHLAVNSSRPTGLIVWGPWRELLSARQQVSGLAGERSAASHEVDLVCSHLPHSYLAVVQGKPEEVARRRPALKKFGARLTALTVVRAEPRGSGWSPAVEVASLTAWPGRIAGLSKTGRGVLLHPARASGGRVPALGIGRHVVTAEHFVPDPNLPRDLMFAGEELFRELAFRSADTGAMPASVTPGTEIQFRDGLAYQAGRRLLQQGKLTCRLLTPVRERTLVRYQVSDGKEKTGQIKMADIKLLRTLWPDFEKAYPAVQVSARLAEGPLQLTSTEAADPERFRAGLVAGQWVSDRDSSMQVVLPAELAQALGVGVGEGVNIHFPRSEVPRGESVTLNLQVKALTASKALYIPAPLANDVIRWRDRELEYNEARGVFESSRETSERAGHVRCVFFARDGEAVEPLVKRLRQRGYHTEDHLAEQQQVRQLGRMMISIVVFFVSGGIIIAAITVWLTTTLHIQAKIWEIGILRSMGVPARDVLGIFLFQGLILGSVGSVLAVSLFVLTQGWFRQEVAQTLGITDPAFLAGRPWDLDLIWLPALVGVISVGFSVLGVLLPSISACRKMPAETLRQRE